MENRNTKLLEIRPIIATAGVNDMMSDEERFQNVTLRPIIKFQNDLLIEAFRNYAKKRKNVFYERKLEERIHYINHAISKDLKFRNSLKGMVIGQFTVSEYNTYILNSSALNKRMMNLVKQRLQDQIQLFETPLIEAS
jgi:hypothetical protein